MAKLNVPGSESGDGAKRKLILPGGGGGGEGDGEKPKLVVPGDPGGGASNTPALPAAEEAPEAVEETGPAVPTAEEFGETEANAGDDLLIIEEEEASEPAAVPVEAAGPPAEAAPVQVASMVAPDPDPEPEPEPEPVAPEVAEAEPGPVVVSSMAPPSDVGGDEAPVEEIAPPVETPEVMAVPAAAPQLVVPAAAPVQQAPSQRVAPPTQTQAIAPPTAGYAAPVAAAGYVTQGMVDPSQTAMMGQPGYQVKPQRMVPGWSLVLIGILMGMVITVLAVKFSPLGEMLVGPVYSAEEMGY